MSEDWNEVPEDYHGHREMDDTHVIISKKDFATKYVSRVLYDEAQARIAELEAENAALKAALEKIRDWTKMYGNGTAASTVIHKINSIAREGLGK